MFDGSVLVVYYVFTASDGPRLMGRYAMSVTQDAVCNLSEFLATVLKDSYDPDTYAATLADDLTHGSVVDVPGCHTKSGAPVTYMFDDWDIVDDNDDDWDVITG